MPKLIARNGDREGTEYKLEKGTFVLGRSGKCDIPVPSVKASRKHAEIYFEAGSFRLRDLDSSNGTLVNKRRVKETVPLQSGDHIQIGHNVLEFIDENAPAIKVVEDAPPAPAAPAGEAAGEAAGEPRREPHPFDRGVSSTDKELLIVGLVVIGLLAAVGAYMLAKSLRGGSTPPAASAESEPPN
jgi:predicted component of type VI protein secretion system